MAGPAMKPRKSINSPQETARSARRIMATVESKEMRLTNVLKENKDLGLKLAPLGKTLLTQRFSFDMASNVFGFLSEREKFRQAVTKNNGYFLFKVRDLHAQRGQIVKMAWESEGGQMVSKKINEKVPGVQQTVDFYKGVKRVLANPLKQIGLEVDGITVPLQLKEKLLSPTGVVGINLRNRDLAKKRLTLSPGYNLRTSSFEMNAGLEFPFGKSGQPKLAKR